MYLEQTLYKLDNSITSIVNLSDILNTTSETDKIKFISSWLNEDALSLNFWMKNTLALSEIESHNMIIEISKIDFLNILFQIKDELKYQINSKKIDLKFVVDCHDDIYLDKDKVYLILLNLISNAIEFSPLASEVIIEVLQYNEIIKIFVKDFGEGIDIPEESVYECFEKSNNSINRDYKGLGIGLYIVKKLVDFLGAKIEFQSTLLESTVFEVTLTTHF